MSNIYREGSKLFEVYAVFLKKGIDAAIAHGNSIGLAASTLKIQVKRKNWGGDAANGDFRRNPRAPAATIKIASPAKVKATKATRDNGQPRFKMKKGKRLFVVVSEGPQQSICRWLDSGDEQCMSNSWMIPAEGAKG